MFCRRRVGRLPKMTTFRSRNSLWASSLVLLFLFLCDAPVASGNQHPIPSGEGSVLGHGGGGGGPEVFEKDGYCCTKKSDDGHGHGHGGVRLASWRWEEYGSILMVLLFIILAGVLKLLFHHTPILAEHFPESCVLIVIGFLLGSIIYYGLESHHQEFFPEFTSALFFNVLLPPIILDAAYALYDRDFLSNLGSVILFAVVGTLFNVFAIGYLLYFLSQVGAMGTFNVTLWPGEETCPGETASQPDNLPTKEMDLDAVHSLIFSSLISAVDPVAVLAIFEEIGVNMGLYFLVFGESLLNDGVTVVLYNTMIALSGQRNIEYDQYILAFVSFFTVVFGGLSIGIIIGALTAFILRFTKHTRVIEPLIVFTMSYLAYILAETIHWSGIISLIGCGVMQKRYAFPNISKKSYTTVKYSVKTLASFSDCIIFLFLGIVAFKDTLVFKPVGFILWTIVLCLVIRFIGVFSLSWIINKRRIKQISYKEQFIMAYGGLRGAVGFSLAKIIDPHDPFKPIFLTTTLIMIFFTVFLQGGTIKFMVGWLNIDKKEKAVKMISTDVNEKTIDHVMAGVESVIGKLSRHRILTSIRRFDNKYTKKLLIRDDAEDIMALRFQRITLDDHYARLYGPAVMIHQQVEEGGQGKAAHTDFTEEDRRKLLSALANTPFERYRHKAFHHDSPEHVQSALKADHEDKFKRLEFSLASDLASRRRKRRMTAEADLAEEVKPVQDGPSIVVEEENEEGEEGASFLRPSPGPMSAEPDLERGRLLWHAARLNAASIKQQYREAKGEFKQPSAASRPTSTREEKETEKQEGDNGQDETKL